MLTFFCCCGIPSILFSFFVCDVILLSQRIKKFNKKRKALIIFLRAIVWYALHMKFSKKLMSHDICRSNHTISEQHHDMCTTFPTKINDIHVIIALNHIPYTHSFQGNDFLLNRFPVFICKWSIHGLVPIGIVLLVCFRLGLMRKKGGLQSQRFQ